MSRSGLVAVIFAVAVLAGCVGSDDEPAPGTQDGSEENATDGSGTLEGVVMDEDLNPVDGARVSVVANDSMLAETETDDQGRYRITDIDPGEYRVQITASCCREHVQGVTIEADETAGINVQLIRFTQDEVGTPYVERGEWTGFLSCSYRDAQGSGNHLLPCEDLDDNTDRIHDLDLKRGLKTIVVGMDWDNELTNFQGQLVLRHYVAPWQSNSPTFFRIDAEPPIEVTIGPEDASSGEDLYFENIESTWNTQFQVWAGGTPNVVYQQPFSVWYDLYYWEEAPDGASALPT